MPVEELQAARGAVRPPRILRGRLRQGRPKRAPYPMGATGEQMRRAGGCADRLYCNVLGGHDAEEGRTALTEFPRDTRHELLTVFHTLWHGGRVVMTSPSRYRCPSMVLDDFEWKYGGDQLQPALLWRGDREWWLMFGQVRIRGGVRWAHRVDFLIYYKRAGKPGQWMFLELDGSQHELTPNQDAQRTEGLALPEIRHDNAQALSLGYFERLLRDVRDGAVRAEPLVRERKKRARVARRRREQEAEQRRAMP